MKIKFSHAYRKLIQTKYNCSREFVHKARLLDVVRVKLEDLSAKFLDYDTDNGVYPLPKKGDYMMLLFLKPSGADIFPTLRRWTPEKERYYRDGIGVEFDIEITEVVK